MVEAEGMATGLSLDSRWFKGFPSYGPRNPVRSCAWEDGAQLAR